MSFSVSGGASLADFTMQPLSTGEKTLAYIPGGSIYKQVLTNGNVREHGVLVGHGNNLVSSLSLIDANFQADDLVAYVIGANLGCDFGDAPDTAGAGFIHKNDYQTLWASNGPLHQIAPTPIFYLGAGVTTETQGQPMLPRLGILMTVLQFQRYAWDRMPLLIQRSMVRAVIYKRGSTGIKTVYLIAQSKWQLIFKMAVRAMQMARLMVKLN